MFSTVLQELKGYFSRDFMLSAFFPLLIFTGASLALFVEIDQSLGAGLAMLEKLSVLDQAIALLAWLLLVAFLAYLIDNFQYSITRFFEGYWSRIPLLSQLRNLRVDLYKKRWEYLDALIQSAKTITEANEVIAEQLAFYPPPNHLDKMMPTKVGNILRAAELHAYDRYGIDSTIIWPRLRPLLKTEAIAPLEDKKTTLEFMLLMSLLGILFTIFWCPVIAIYTNRWDLFLLCALGLPLAWVCYQNAIQSALAYGEQVKATFDLYRNDLLKALNRPIPTDTETERKEWLRLSRFFHRNLPIPPSPASPSKPKNWERVAEALANYLEKLDAPDSRTQEEQQ
jgi:hypothetical protein